MFTDKPPEAKDRADYLESDRINTLDLPQDARLLSEIAKKVEAAMQTGNTTEVRVACAEFLSEASRFYQVPKCGVRVLEARPLKGREWVTELFGDYQPTTMLIRLWMRTARKKEITSYGTFLSTLCHEFCHHLDYHLFKFSDSWHTRGFYERTAVLYPPWSAENGSEGRKESRDREDLDGTTQECSHGIYRRLQGQKSDGGGSTSTVGLG